MLNAKEKRRETWARFHAYIRNNGGNVVSLPDLSPIIFQCAPDCKLPAEFERMKYDIRELGEVEALGPITEAVPLYGGAVIENRQHVTIIKMMQYALDLPEEK